ncbi:MAG: MFS transporter, partial [Fusobacteriaceae bacterium]
MRGKLKLSTKILYGAGVSYAIVDQIFAQWILYFYLPPANSGLKVIIPPLMLSIALALSRSVDVITDPLVGYLSDRTVTRWGRRIPYIAIGTVPLSL